MSEHPSAVALEPIFLRRRDTAALLGISESLVQIYERRGWLQTVRLPKIKTEDGKRGDGGVRHALDDVRRLAAKIRAGELA